jgi:hypothetical protein
MLSATKQELDDSFNNSLNIVSGLHLPLPTRVYIGAEFCDRLLLNANFNILTPFIKELKSKGFFVTLIMPHSTQSLFKSNYEILKRMLDKGKDVIDEISVNDFGLLNYINNDLQGMNLRFNAGRLLDKSLRESRMDIYSVDDIRKNKNMISKLPILTNEYDRIYNKFNISYVETDIPNQKVFSIIDNANYKLALHFPRTFLSKAYYCEFSSIGKSAINKFILDGVCENQCNNQYKIFYEDSIKLYKVGNAIFSKIDDQSLLKKFEEKTNRIIFSDLLS